jgi:hypothetical protein
LDATGHEIYTDREAMRAKFNGYYAYIGRAIEDSDDFLVIGFELVE